MKMIDMPALKQVLWQRMRDDLKSLVPWFADNDLLLCPTCCRPLPNYEEANRAYWSEPFKITVDRDSAFIALRNMSFKLPLSRDPTLPLARTLLYVPSKYTFRPDLTTVFD